MFKVVLVNGFGPFAGMGGYGSVKGVGISRSPKKAFEQARRAVAGKDAGGGVPILSTAAIYRNGKHLTTEIL